MQKLRWGVIGADTIAVVRTIPALLESEEAALTAVMNTTPEKAETVRQQFGAKRAYTSAEALVSDPEVDCVYIATPVYLHAPQIRLAADHGKHILCEKPLGLNAKEAQEAVEYCKKRGVTLSVGFMMRYGAHVRQMREAIRGGEIGQVVSGNGRFSCWTPDSPGFWLHQREKSGGGPVMDMGIHLIDLVRYITGLEVTHVAAMQERITFTGEDYTVDDASTLLLRLENGGQFVLQTNFNIPDPCSKWVLDFYGTAGRLLGDTVVHQLDTGLLNKMALAPEDDRFGDTAMGLGKTLTADYGNLYTQEIDDFCRAVRNHAAPVIDPMDAVRAQRIIDAAYEASRCGKTVAL